MLVCDICEQHVTSPILIGGDNPSRVTLCDKCHSVVFSKAVIASTNEKEITEFVESHFDNENAADRAVKIALAPLRVHIPSRDIISWNLGFRNKDIY